MISSTFIWVVRIFVCTAHRLYAVGLTTIGSAGRLQNKHIGLYIQSISSSPFDTRPSELLFANLHMDVSLIRFLLSEQPVVSRVSIQLSYGETNPWKNGSSRERFANLHQRRACNSSFVRAL